MAFEPLNHLTKVGGKDYLETKWRLVWYREDHPHGILLTDVLQTDPPLVKATVCDADGAILAIGHGTAKAKPGAVWAGRELEKAETAAIGRALGHAGYGTQFTDEDDADHLADSPVGRAQGAQNGNKPPQQRQQPAPPASTRPTEAQTGTPAGSPNGSPSSTPNGTPSGDDFAKQFPASGKWTPAMLFDRTDTFFNHRAHFDKHWEKHEAEYEGLTIDEAVALVHRLHWNYDKTWATALVTSAKDEFGMTVQNVMDALTDASPHSVKQFRQWDSGTYEVALEACAAWAEKQAAKDLQQEGASA